MVLLAFVAFLATGKVVNLEAELAQSGGKVVEFGARLGDLRAAERGEGLGVQVWLRVGARGDEPVLGVHADGLEELVLPLPVPATHTAEFI